ncbi:hypothetical protein GNI_106980 [Gregarina niphandrodes]|uniref:Uncharacterized protein n=1 Tax=Gregarina niphandrodes TaxID=110365 RepID=A0A023B3V4_GRENI|nr:hypothetical protein GNI_106980 [Gregarina niphandrodes]EZG55942.1 hypothetical protein GNI_106980 [Gregarina niphandrodes]|eukprot:XP_011131399.1 hypothetical protein GNI_106980 [Gregarina niphandrodes]
MAGGSRRSGRRLPKMLLLLYKDSCYLFDRDSSVVELREREAANLIRTGSVSGGPAKKYFSFNPESGRMETKYRFHYHVWTVVLDSVEEAENLATSTTVVRAAGTTTTITTTTVSGTLRAGETWAAGKGTEAVHFRGPAPTLAHGLTKHVQCPLIVIGDDPKAEVDMLINLPSFTRSEFKSYLKTCKTSINSTGELRRLFLQFGTRYELYRNNAGLVYNALYEQLLRIIDGYTQPPGSDFVPAPAGAPILTRYGDLGRLPEDYLVRKFLFNVRVKDELIWHNNTWIPLKLLGWDTASSNLLKILNEGAVVDILNDNFFSQFYQALAGYPLVHRAKPQTFSGCYPGSGLLPSFQPTSDCCQIPDSQFRSMNAYIAAESLLKIQNGFYKKVCAHAFKCALCHRIQVHLCSDVFADATALGIDLATVQHGCGETTDEDDICRTKSTTDAVLDCIWDSQFLVNNPILFDAHSGGPNSGVNWDGLTQLIGQQFRRSRRQLRLQSGALQFPRGARPRESHPRRRSSRRYEIDEVVVVHQLGGLSLLRLFSICAPASQRVPRTSVRSEMTLYPPMYVCSHSSSAEESQPSPASNRALTLPHEICLDDFSRSISNVGVVIDSQGSPTARSMEDIDSGRGDHGRTNPGLEVGVQKVGDLSGDLMGAPAGSLTEDVMREMVGDLVGGTKSSPPETECPPPAREQLPVTRPRLQPSTQSALLWSQATSVQARTRTSGSLDPPPDPDDGNSDSEPLDLTISDELDDDLDDEFEEPGRVAFQRMFVDRPSWTSRKTTIEEAEELIWTDVVDVYHLHLAPYWTVAPEEAAGLRRTLGRQLRHELHCLLRLGPGPVCADALHDDDVLHGHCELDADADWTLTLARP